MRRFALTLALALAVTSLVAATRPIASHAESLGMVTTHEHLNPLLHDSLSLDDITRLQIEYGRTMRSLAAELPGWGCAGGDRLIDKPAVLLEFKTGGPVFALDDDHRYTVAFGLKLNGQTVRQVGPATLDWSDAEVRSAAGSDDPVDGLIRLGRAWIEDLMRAASPCKLTLDLKLTGETQIFDARFSFEYAGVVRDIVLDADGKARFTAPLTVKASAAGACDYRIAVEGATAAGRIEYRDGGLRFSQLRISHQVLTAACDAVGCEYVDLGVARGTCKHTTPYPFTTSFGLLAGTGADLAADSIVSMPMTNAAMVTLPRPALVNPNLAAWDASVVLDYRAR